MVFSANCIRIHSVHTQSKTISNRLHILTIQQLRSRKHLEPHTLGTSQKQMIVKMAMERMETQRILLTWVNLLKAGIKEEDHSLREDTSHRQTISFQALWISTQGRSRYKRSTKRIFRCSRLYSRRSQRFLWMTGRSMSKKWSNIGETFLWLFHRTKQLS